MNNINTKRSNIININSFRGLDLTDTHKSPDGTSELINFRVSEDGSLQKRKGTYKALTANGNIRAVWSGRIDGSFCCYIISGNKVCSVDLTGGTYTVLATLTTSSSEAQLFWYRGNLYAVDGSGLYCIKNGTATAPFGYVPLRGKDWSDGVLGELYEPRNLLNNKGRFEYIISDAATSVLMLDDFVSSVDAIFINGEPIGPERYNLGAYSPYINVSGLHAGDRVKAFVTYVSSPSGLNELSSCTRAVVFGGISNSRPFLFEGDDRSVIFSSVYVAQSKLDEICGVYSEADTLYFPAGCELRVGDGRYSVSTVSRHYDRLLIHTDGGTWRADSAAWGLEDMPIMNINTSVEVFSENGSAVLRNTPYTVGAGGIYRWTADTDELDECNAVCISSPIAPLLTEDFLKSAVVFADKWRGEVFFANRQASDRIFVYSERSDTWTCFKGIDADLFFESENGMGYIDGSGIYLFDESRTTDSGTQILAVYTGNISDLGSTTKKHLSSVEVCSDHGSVKVDIYLDGKSSPAVSEYIGSTLEHSRYKKRLTSRRFEYLQCTLTCDWSGASAIHSLTVKTR